MAELLKEVYTKEYIENLASKIALEYGEFKKEDFISSIFSKEWESLELKARMRHIALKLNEFLPMNYEKQLEILKSVSKEFFSFEAMFFQDFVGVFGLENFDSSMKALEVFTIDSSSEFAIREFILRYEDKTLLVLNEWSKSENEHIRRLSSEGCRPRLPWAVALPEFKKDPTKILKIIETLKNDSSLYVRKSVANNLNDISKDNPQVVIEFVKSNLGFSKELDWVCKHASRTLLKKGDKDILELFGYKKTSHVRVEELVCKSEIFIGEEFEFAFVLQSDEVLGNLRVEYEIEYQKANNKTSKKIFMISQNELKVKNKKFSKKQSFKNMTTRKHYEGEHKVFVVVNGEVKGSKSFMLKSPKE